MKIAFGLNLSIALIWLFLSDHPSISSFIVGLLLGFLLLAFFPQPLNARDYVRRVIAFFRFVIIFHREFIVSNVVMAHAVLFRDRESIHPNYLTFDTRGMRPFEILLLSHCITLTPGTTTIDIEPDYSAIIFHAFDADDPAAVRRAIEKNLKQHILAFTR